MLRTTALPALLLSPLFALTPGARAQDANKPIDFLRDIAPIFKSRCIECHGADEPEADLRLDIRAGLFVADKKDWVVIPNNSGKSILLDRITRPADDLDIMPPEGKPLTKAQIATIKRWIDEGAKWPKNADAKAAATAAAKTAPKTPAKIATPPKIEKLDLPVLTAAEKSAEAAALAAIQKAGGRALRIAASSGGTEVNLSLLQKKATNSQVALTSPLSRSLVRLNLSATAIDDEALKIIAGHRQLRWLNLSCTDITDAGLRHLAGLSKLRYLNLYGTQITRAGLPALRGVSNLQNLFVWQTKITAKDAAALRESLPKLRVELGDYSEVLAEMERRAEKKKKANAPINAKCPLTGRPVAAGQVSVFEKKVVGFCCKKCKASFDKNPVKYREKISKVTKTTKITKTAKTTKTAKPKKPPPRK